MAVDFGTKQSMGSVAQSKILKQWGNFWTAKKPRSSSYVWRSILGIRDILKKGCLWSVGNGSSINIWEDRWIPDHPFDLDKPDNQPHIPNFVSDLIDVHQKQWKDDLLCQIDPFVAAARKRIPLSDDRRKSC